MQEEIIHIIPIFTLGLWITYEGDTCFPLSLVAVKQKHTIKVPHSLSSDKPQRFLTQPQDALITSVRPFSFAGSSDTPMDKGCFSSGHREISATSSRKLSHGPLTIPGSVTTGLEAGEVAQLQHCSFSSRGDDSDCLSKDNYPQSW